MKEGINRTRAANFHKASELKKLGFATAVHALPPEVKTELDRLLLSGTSVRESLKATSNLFPDAQLPSVNATNNYKNKYLLGSATQDSATGVVIDKNETDKVVAELKTSIGEFYIYLSKEVLPQLAESLKKGLEVEAKVNLPMKVNSDRTMAIAKLIGEMNNFARGQGLQVLAFERSTSTVTPTTPSGEDEEDQKPQEDVYDKLARVLTRRGFTVTTTTERGIAVSQG